MKARACLKIYSRKLEHNFQTHVRTCLAIHSCKPEHMFYITQFSDTLKDVPEQSRGAQKWKVVS